MAELSRLDLEESIFAFSTSAGGSESDTRLGCHSTLPVIPGFEFLERIGTGGMGVVFKARQVRLNRPVAIKFLLNVGRIESNAAARFLAEAQSMAEVKHANVVAVYDFGEAFLRDPHTPGQPVAVPYLVMELLEGGHFGEVLGPTSARNVQSTCAALAKVCRGVAAAHEAGIIHRDLKPANILFSRAGEPKVVDFGLAKRAISNLTQSVAVMGTPYYMSPEQAQGKSKSVCPATDVWALGVILYRGLTGRLPFDSENQFSLLHRIITEDPDAPSVHNAEMSPVLEAIVLKCLAKRPDRRFANAGELARALERYALDSDSDLSRRGAKPSRIDWALIAAVFLLVGMAGTCFVLWQKSAIEIQRYRGENTQPGVPVTE